MEPGRGKLAELSQRAVVLAIIASLHALLLYLLASGSLGSAGRLSGSVMEAELIAAERRMPEPPPLPPVILQASSPIAPPPLQTAIEVPAEQAPTPQAIDTRDLSDSPPPAQPPVLAPAPSEVDAGPVVRPRPIAGPRGEDRYPKASIKAKESGTVEMNICVSPAGKVDSVEIARSSGFARLDQVALGIAAEYRFQPATRQGRPVAACAHYHITFKLS
jgi:periplasmic protein TonB